MREEKVMLKAPPRLLLGLGFLFWGAMGDYPFAGLLGAIAFEARHWTSVRWKFGEKGFVRAWQLCIVILIIVAVQFFASDEERTAGASLELLSWLPFIFMPLGLAQQYSADRGVPLTSFSYFARRKINLDRKAGRPVLLHPAQIGFPYLGVTLVSAGLGLWSVYWYGVGIVLLFGIGLYFMTSERKRPLAWGLAYLGSIGLAVVLTLGVFQIYGRLGSQRYAQQNDSLSARETRTQLGNIGELLLSPKIDWRYYHREGGRPKRLRLAVYDEPKSDERGPSYWQARLRLRKWVEQIDRDRDVGGGFESLFVEEDAFAYREEFFGMKGGHRSEIVGLVDDENLIPLPRNVLRFENVAAESMEANSQGSTRISDPENGAIRIEVVGGDQDQVASVDLDPSIRDLELPPWEYPGLTAYWEKLGVEDLPEWAQKNGRPIRRPEWAAGKSEAQEQHVLRMMLQADFAENFSYTLRLSSVNNAPPVTHFLEDLKSGHCEYFASATALLFRRAGIPARYAVGYVVDEEGKKAGEYLLRGKHAHAWVQAYFGGEWVNEAAAGDRPVWRCRGGEWMEVDLTPATWLEQFKTAQDWQQALSDWSQTTLADLILWFSGTLVSLLIKLLLGGALLLIVARVAYRLWVTRGGGDPGVDSWEMRSCRANPLADFEKWLAREIGERPRSLPLGAWLREKAPELVPAYQQLRFDPKSAGAEEELRAEARKTQMRLREEAKNT